LVAYLHREPIGCGAVKRHTDGPDELGRMWIAPVAGGLGSTNVCWKGSRPAHEGGATVAHLETSVVLSEALSLYRSTGWIEAHPFNDEPFADHWFEKTLI
jgi:hypothetical protein